LRSAGQDCLSQGLPPFKSCIGHVLVVQLQDSANGNRVVVLRSPPLPPVRRRVVAGFPDGARDWLFRSKPTWFSESEWSVIATWRGKVAGGRERRGPESEQVEMPMMHSPVLSTGQCCAAGEGVCQSRSTSKKSFRNKIGLTVRQRWASLG
jgi:hypothetical protein